MDISTPEISKLMKMFCVIGLDETKVTKYLEEENKVRFVQDLDIVKKKKTIDKETILKENEKWLNLLMIG